MTGAPLANAADRIGILGGTFDPIHIGHLIAASEVAAQLGLDRVLFVPAGEPWHKRGRSITAVGHRLSMVHEATGPDRRFAVSRVDVDRPGPTYTIDTVHDLRAEYGADSEFFLIVGQDAAAGIMSWRDPVQLQHLVRVVEVSRSGGLAAQRVNAGPRTASVHRRIAIPTVDVSSSDVRVRVAQGRPFRYLVTAAVYDYIVEHGLYRGATDRSTTGATQGPEPRAQP